ncbi:MAG: serine hydrolase [Chloroflexota bacterium]|nr:serine hydrolase [Chloroflexota bacterium]
MSDETSSQAAPTGDLTERIAALLEPLGGRTAAAAQRFGPLPGKSFATGGASASVAIRADEVFPAASLAKLPIAIELMRRADLGLFDLRERFDTAEEPRVGGAGVLDMLDPTTRLTLGDLCALMLVVSDNTAANFILDLVGMGEVNETIGRLKTPNTHLARHFMDTAARDAGRDNTTSAGDMLTMMSLIRGNALPGGRYLRELLLAQQSFSELTEGWLPTTAKLAHKDGTLEGVVHDTGILSGPGGVAMYCVLTAEQPDTPAARAAVGATLRLLWDEWRLG